MYNIARFILNRKYMRSSRFFLAVLLAGTFTTNSVMAQESKNVPKRLEKQEQAFKDGNYMFPAQKKSNWAIGLMVGPAFISSDVKAGAGGGIGGTLQKAFGHAFSLRGQLTTGITTGQNYQWAQGYANHGNANPWQKYYGSVKNGLLGTPGTKARNVFYNYRMTWMDASVQGVVNLNNINFYKEQNKWGFYATGGFGASAYSTYVDALDLSYAEMKDRTLTAAEIAQHRYNFDNVSNFTPTTKTNIFSFFGKQKKPILDELHAIRQGSWIGGKIYETRAEAHTDEQQFNFPFGDKRTYIVNPFINASVGVLYKISRRIDVGIEHRIAWTNDDLLDGQRWQEHGGAEIGGLYYGRTAMTRDFDSYHFTAVLVNFRLGKGEESMWWNNPLSEMYGSIADTRKIVKGMTEDNDNDGVPDIFDKDPETPEGERVDVTGRALDNDLDGFPDSKDAEPFTPKPCANDVDNNGKAKDSDNDHVPDCFDDEPNSPANAYVDARGRNIPIPKELKCEDCEQKWREAMDKYMEENKGKINIGNNTNPPVDPVINTGYQPCNLPSIHFDADRVNVKQEFYPDIYAVARYMIDNPIVKVKVTGHTDKTGAGADLVIKKRVENVINMLVSQYNIDRNRFVTEFTGNVGINAGTSGSNPKQPKDEALGYLNRRVDFSCVW
jgi:outer membrane protein OmpA-like peptidoglycan-associated protein